VRLLLDTQLAVWWQIASDTISASARAAILEAEGSVFVSRASLWKLAIKVANGKLALDLPWFSKQLVDDGFEWLDVKQAHILEVAKLRTFDDHKDPFDRLLVAQSLTEPLILLTTDTKLMRYGSTVHLA
jgi:PIN domain nuclease of toxin-antitoxin system